MSTPQANRHPWVVVNDRGLHWFDGHVDATRHFEPGWMPCIEAATRFATEADAKVVADRVGGMVAYVEPAPPRPAPQPAPIADGDLSLRDYFAATALTGLLAFNTAPEGCHQYAPAEAARHAYAMADAMLAERSKPVEGGAS